MAVVLMLSCRGNMNKDMEYNESLEKVKHEMNFADVEVLAGKPTSVENLGTSVSETGDTVHLVQWFYGKNQSVIFTNKKVTGVDLDMKATQQHIQHIIDSAKAAEGNSGFTITPGE